MNSKFPNGSKMALVETDGLKPGDPHLFNLVGLSAEKVQCLVDAMIECGLSSSSEEMLAVIPTMKLFG